MPFWSLGKWGATKNKWIHQHISRYLWLRVHAPVSIWKSHIYQERFVLRLTSTPNSISIFSFARKANTKLRMSFDRNGNFHFKLELKCISAYREWLAQHQLYSSLEWKKCPLKAKRTHIKERVGVHLEHPFSKQSPSVAPPFSNRWHYGNGARSGI